VPEKLRSSITFWHTEWLLSGFGAPSISCYAWSAALFVFFLILARVGGRRTWKHVRLIRTTSEVFPVCALVRAAPNVGFANYWDQNWGTYPFFPQNWWIVEFNSPLCGVLATHQLHEVVRKGNHLKVGLEANHANFHELSVAKSLVYHAAATWRGRAAVCERTQVATQLSCGDTVTKFVANNVGPTCIFVLPHRRARLFWLRRLSFSVLLGRPTRRSIILQFLDRRTYMYQTDIQWYNDWCRHWHIHTYLYVHNAYTWIWRPTQWVVGYLPIVDGLKVSSVVTSLLLINQECIKNSSINPFSHQPVEFWCGSAWWFHGKSRNWTTAINDDHSKSKIDGWDSKDAKQFSVVCVFFKTCHWIYHRKPIIWSTQLVVKLDKSPISSISFRLRWFSSKLKYYKVLKLR
jgi:hypothetical protein